MYEYQFDGKSYEKYRDNTTLFEIKRHISKGYYAHFHYAVEVCYVLRGVLKISINGKMMTVEENDIVFINPREMHQYFPNEECELYVVIMSDFYSQDYTMELGAIRFNNLLQNKHLNIKIKELFDQCYENRKRNLLFENKIFVNQLYSYLYRNYSLKEQTGNEPFLGKILEYIYEHYKEEITIKSLAEEFAYSPTFISKIFQQEIGVDFRVFVNEIRAERVHIMLNDSKYSEWGLSQIVMECGFVSMATFYRSYQRRFNCTPERRKI